MTSFKSNVVLNNGEDTNIQGPKAKCTPMLDLFIQQMLKTAKISRFTFGEKISKCKDDWIFLTVLLTETLFSNRKECCISITAI
ncbi:hypothetical protein TNCV_3842621 [Trichonephila clavipes]|nr:hypothetical protein TNCV_3842621 [Trichonephila clavipes]